MATITITVPDNLLDDIRQRVTPDEDGWIHYDDYPRAAVADLRVLLGHISKEN